MPIDTASYLRLRLVTGFEFRHGSAAVEVRSPAQRLMAYPALQNRPRRWTSPSHTDLRPDPTFDT